MPKWKVYLDSTSRVPRISEEIKSESGMTLIEVEADKLEAPSAESRYGDAGYTFKTGRDIVAHFPSVLGIVREQIQPE